MLLMIKMFLTTYMNFYTRIESSLFLERTDELTIVIGRAGMIGIMFGMFGDFESDRFSVIDVVVVAIGRCICG